MGRDPVGYFGGTDVLFALLHYVEESDSGRQSSERLDAVPQVAQRRSERVLMDVPVIVSGEFPDHRSFREETFTVTVSAHGALMMLATKVKLGQRLVVTNPANDDTREVRVAYLGSPHAGLSQVAIEFARPSPEFWPVSPAPADWNVA
ncbi:MAG TPA: hypothetical protein VEI08_01120, partial [Candidatus Bathyarchaeia archaeon]|nr:hypothetical protein [Candidatus Bathyarchaeia archaeon]